VKGFGSRGRGKETIGRRPPVSSLYADVPPEKKRWEDMLEGRGKREGKFWGNSGERKCRCFVTISHEERRSARQPRQIVKKRQTGRKMLTLRIRPLEKAPGPTKGACSTYL